MNPPAEALRHRLSPEPFALTFLEVRESWHRLLPLLLMVVYSISRWPALWPKEWASFSAAYALAFCAGVYFPKRTVWWLPLGCFFCTDAVLNLFYYKASLFTPYMALNYVMYAFLIWFGRQHSPHSSFLRLLCGGLLGAAIFYFVTNTAAWIQNPQYPKTLAGWVQALTVGIPGWPPTWTFFRNTLLSGGLFTGLFVGAMKLTASEEEEEEETPAEEPEENKA